MLVRPRIVHSDKVFCIACWRNAIIVDVAGSIDLQHMKRMGRAYRELLTEHPQGIVSFALLRPGVPIAPGDARNESARFMKELGDSVLRVAMVIEAKGILAQMMQTVVRGINVLTRNPKLVMFGSIDEAAVSLAPLIARPDASPADPSEEDSDVGAALRAAVLAVRGDYSPDAAPQLRVQ